MSEQTVKLLPLETPQPVVMPKPIDRSQRWVSPYEAEANGIGISVFLNRAAYIRAVVHASSDTAEVGGVLVGQWCLDEEDGCEFILINHAIPARHTIHGSAYLTFTQDSLVDMHYQIEQRYEGQRIVGWYHTHPGMGVFFSHYDAWLHHNFFPEPWQAALVIEPFTSQAGFFIRQEDGELLTRAYYGFHELVGESGTSIVRWNNLWQAGIMSQGD